MKRNILIIRIIIFHFIIIMLEMSKVQFFFIVSVKLFMAVWVRVHMCAFRLCMLFRLSIPHCTISSLYQLQTIILPQKCKSYNKLRVHHMRKNTTLYKCRCSMLAWIKPTKISGFKLKKNENKITSITVTIIIIIIIIIMIMIIIITTATTTNLEVSWCINTCVNFSINY